MLVHIWWTIGINSVEKLIPMLFFNLFKQYFSIWNAVYLMLHTRLKQKYVDTNGKHASSGTFWPVYRYTTDNISEKLPPFFSQLPYHWLLGQIQHENHLTCNRKKKKVNIEF